MSGASTRWLRTLWLWLWLWLWLVMAASPAQAHDTAILPQQFRAASSAPLTATVSAGHGLTPLNGPRRRRLGVAALVGARTLRRPRRFKHGKIASTLGFGTAPAGVKMLALTTPLTFIELNDSITGRYLDEVQPPAAQRALWDAQCARGEGWCEWYAKDACTYLAGGHGPWQRLPQRAARLKQRLVLLPLNDPTRLRVGAALRVRALLDGKPVADLALRLFDTRGNESVVRTDARGMARLALPRRGPHLIATTVLQEPAAVGQPWSSRFGTLGFHVGRA